MDDCQFIGRDGEHLVNHRNNDTVGSTFLVKQVTRVRQSKPTPGTLGGRSIREGSLHVREGPEVSWFYFRSRE